MGQVDKKFDKEVINPRLCSQETINKVKAVMENVVKKGTGKKLYSPNFSMAGKTGTAQVNYGGGGKTNGDMYYSSSFVGYFPADEPLYSCIVVIHKPHVAKGYYGADVSGPVFRRIAQKYLQMHLLPIRYSNWIKTLRNRNSCMLFMMIKPIRLKM